MPPKAPNLFLCAFIAAHLPVFGGAQEPRLIESEPLRAPSEGGATLFTEVPAERSGITHAYELVEDHPLRRLYAFGYFTGAPCLGDLDGDGRVDLFLAGTTSPNRLYLQTGDMQFVEQAEAAGVSGPDVWSAGASLLDIDNDGDLDIYVPVYNEKNQLFINESVPGELKFREMADVYNLKGDGGSLNSAFADIDQDGDLDLYLQTYHQEPEKGRPLGEMEIDVILPNEEVPNVRVPIIANDYQPYYSAYFINENTVSWSETGRPDYLLQNNGRDLPFDDITDLIGVNPGRTYGTSAVFWDVDHNLFPDLFSGSDLEDPDLLYYSGGKKGMVRATPAMLPSTSWMTRGAAAADFNGDLLIDLVTADTMPIDPALDAAHEYALQNYETMAMVSELSQHMRNSLFLNTGTVRLTESAHLAGIERTGSTWSVKAADFDLDGSVDLFFANGNPRDPLATPRAEMSGEKLIGKTRWDIISDKAPGAETDQIYQNDGTAKFSEVNAKWGIGATPTISGGAAVGDIDGDGDLDLVVCRLGESVAVYLNGATDGRIVIDLEGQGSNIGGVGAQVLVETPDGRRQMRQLFPTSGFMGTDDSSIPFGIGSETSAKVTVRWPSGAVQTYENLAPGMRHTIREAITLLTPIQAGGLAKDGKALFATSPAMGGIVMQERSYNDGELQALLPNELSHQGPSVAWSDVDGDGRSEAYFGGSAVNAGRLISQSAALGKLEQGFKEHFLVEDGASVFFDADGDGDLDLMVSTGGIEVEAGSIGLRDRLYVNDGNGKFTVDESLLSNEARVSAGAIAAADFDQDGDVDVFVGTRVAIGEYPKSGKSSLLINDGSGKLTDTTPEGLADSGMVTGALWTDVDGNGTLDLMTTSEWGAIRLWKNTGGTLTEQTDAAGLAQLLGRWNGITGRDIDNDGDIDYVVTNIGLNTPYGVGENRISDLYYGEFGANDGKSLIIEAKSRNSKKYPRAGYTSMVRLVEGFAEKFPDPVSYGNATVENVFGQAAVDAAMHLTLTEAASGLLINDGSGRFTFERLPDEAQLAPGFGSVLTDLNYDGIVDVVIAQNLIETPIDFGPFNGGVSSVMLGTGNPDARFKPLLAVESGVAISGAGRAIGANDLDGDSKVDLTITINNNAPATYLNQSETEGYRPLAVRLDRSREKSPIGARVTVKAAGMPIQTAEYYAGEGYLSQSAPILFFGAKADDESAVEVEIRWGDGTTNRRKIYR